MQTKTTGHAIMKRSNHNKKKLFLKPTFIEIINSDTNVLVKKDIIKANIISRYLFILTEYHKTQKVVGKINYVYFLKRKEFVF